MSIPLMLISFTCTYALIGTTPSADVLDDLDARAPCVRSWPCRLRSDGA